MAFDWNNFLTFAESIKRQVESGRFPAGEWADSMKRSGVSRAYYSMYHFSEKYAVSNLGYQPDTSKDTHVKLRFCFTDLGWGDKRRQIQPILARMHKYRKECDYDDELTSDVDAMLESTLLDAEEVKTLLT